MKTIDFPKFQNLCNPLINPTSCIPQLKGFEAIYCNFKSLSLMNCIKLFIS